MSLHIDHIVISVKDFQKSVKFYEIFLGKAHMGQEDAHWGLNGTKLFLTSAYKKSARVFDKHNFGLNHFAFKVESLGQLKKFETKLNKAKIKNSGIGLEQYSKKEFIWFDDPDGIRLEFYLRN